MGQWVGAAFVALSGAAAVIAAPVAPAASTAPARPVPPPASASTQETTAREPAAAPGAWPADADTTFRPAMLTSAPTNTIAQTPDGFLWLGKQDGLVRWDGYRQKAFLADSSVAGALPSSDIQALHVDPRGVLWVGTAVGLARYDSAADRFEVPISGSGALKDGFIRALGSDAAGHLWVGSAAGLHRVDLATMQVHPHVEIAGPAGLPPGLVRALLIDAKGHLWVSTAKGLYVRSAGADRFVKLSLPTAGNDPTRVTALAQDHDGRVWVGTARQGVFIWPQGPGGDVQALAEFTAAPGGDKATEHQAADRSAGHIEEQHVAAILEARPGEVWIGTNAHGIWRVDLQTRRVARSEHLERAPGSLSNDDLYALFRDASGLVWVSASNALSYAVAGQRGFKTIWAQPGNAARIAHADVTYLMAHPNGMLWLGFGNGGIDLVDMATGAIRHARTGQRGAGQVAALVHADDGTVYVGTNSGLYRANADGTGFVRLQVPGRAEAEAIESLCWHRGRLWLGGVDGLWGLDGADKPQVQVAAHLSPEQIKGHTVHQIVADEASDGLWVSAGTTVVAVDLATLAVHELAPESPGQLGVPKGHVTSIVQDRGGRLWLGTYGSGVRLLERRPGGLPQAVRRFTTAEGLAHNGVNKLMLDEAGDVWLSTDEGIARIQRDTLAVTAFSQADGLGIGSYWAYAGARTPANRVVFGGAGGLTVIDPSAVVPWNYRAPIAVTEIHADGGPPRSGAPVGGPLVVAPGDRALMAEFAVLDYSAPDKNRYEYRLRGLDETWKATPASRRLAAYTNLPPGDYTLELRGANRAGPWSAVTEIPVQVPAAWYETLWFKAAVAAAALACVWMLMQLRTLFLRQRQRELQALVDQRTRELQDSQRQLEQLAYFDPLTGLANRRLFNNELRRLIALQHRSEGSFALLLIDLNAFKPINDRHGHDAGDAVLVAVGRRLQATVREVDLVARLGGDEFAVLMPGTDSDDALAVVERRIAQALQSPIAYRHLSMEVGASLGAALFPRDGTDGETLFKAADVALYQMKQRPSNRAG